MKNATKFYLETLRRIFTNYTESDAETVDKAILYISRNTEEGVLQCLKEILDVLDIDTKENTLRLLNGQIYRSEK